MEKYKIVPVPTRILTHHDDICDAILEYAKDKIGPNDVVCAAESVVAITQGRALRCEEFHPSWLAKILSHLFPAKGSISSWYSMQALLDAEGGPRVVWVLGWSKGVDPDKVAEILIDNPFGNGSEKTPICIIKDYHKA